MGRDSKSFSRLPAKYKPQASVLVLCEDTKSGKQYLTDATYDFRVRVQVEIAHCGRTDPLGIVEAAIERQQKYDKIFCVIDRDRHASFDEAIRRARGASKIVVIPSFPCFELWYLLHFQRVTKPYAEEGRNSPADCLIRDLRNCPGMENYAKGNSRSIYADLGHVKLTEARRLSPQVFAEAVRVGNPNPSTRIHELFDYFERLADIEPI